MPQTVHIELRLITSIRQYHNPASLIPQNTHSCLPTSLTGLLYSLLSAVLQCRLDRLQSLLNAAARLTVKAFRSDNTTPIVHSFYFGTGVLSMLKFFLISWFCDLEQALHNQTPFSSKPSKPICLRSTTEFQNFLSCLLHAEYIMAIDF